MTNLTGFFSEDYTKHELSGPGFATKFSTRLENFKYEIMNYYNSILKNKKVLVVGPDDFLEVFKNSCEKNVNCDYVNSIKHIISFKIYDAVIDAKYKNEAYSIIYGQNINSFSFMDLYAKILYNATIKFLKENNITLIYFYEPRYLKKPSRILKNWDETRKDRLLLENYLNLKITI